MQASGGCAVEPNVTFAVTLGPFFLSSAEEPFGKARKIRDPTMSVTATRNFILRSQSLTINKKKRAAVDGFVRVLLALYTSRGKETGIRGGDCCGR